MDILEIIAGSVLILCSVLIIMFVVVQDNKGSGLSGAISGGDIGGMLSRSGERGKNEKLANFTKILAIVFFVVTLAVDIIAILVQE